MGVRFVTGLADSLLAELIGVPQMALHLDIDAMIRAADAGAAVADRLGIDRPAPHLAGLAYVHASTLGCKLSFPLDALEPGIRPCIHRPEDIDALREPDDYLAAGVVPDRLALAAELVARRPDASDNIGHDYEGPVTTAVLMMGQTFFMLPYDDPARAHHLLQFVTRSAIHYTQALRARQQRPPADGAGICDDFAGIFPPDTFAEFVAPYWEMLYAGLGGSRRGLHSELLREAHLPFLKQLHIDEFDPSVDPHLPPETLRRACPVPYTLRIWPSEVMSLPADELVALYRHRATFNPVFVSFHLARLSEEAKIAALLDVARQVA